MCGQRVSHLLIYPSPPAWACRDIPVPHDARTSGKRRVHLAERMDVRIRNGVIDDRFGDRDAQRPWTACSPAAAFLKCSLLHAPPRRSRQSPSGHVTSRASVIIATVPQSGMDSSKRQQGCTQSKVASPHKFRYGRGGQVFWKTMSAQSREATSNARRLILRPMRPVGLPAVQGRFASQSQHHGRDSHALLGHETIPDTHHTPRPHSAFTFAGTDLAAGSGWYSRMTGASTLFSGR
ncbi:hypothetical protein DES53_11674 [Roseimicrobium gellanilyticum]|uniref:Uncharacterized protein n=1 Tax=Roseimicrobium gellanilyticum TaxID=748857 RepID=A0A366H442_9BACT|nr:hypothetical protein DES53_11674 [Roseimicrobium gellanilyticum]